MPIEGYDPEHPIPFERAEPETDAISHNGRPEYRQFQEGLNGIPDHFQASAQVAGLLRRKSQLLVREGRNGVKTDFLAVTLDTGPVYRRTSDPQKKKLRNLIVCWFAADKARRVDKALRDIDDQLRCQPWMVINGTIENRMRLIDMSDVRKGLKPSGEMQIRAHSFLIPPVPKLNQVREKKRPRNFPDAPQIVV